MKRTKAWWGRLSKNERGYLVFLERADKHTYGNDGYLPDGYAECSACSTPCSGGGLCTSCLNNLRGLINKASAQLG
jgi:hypothetical protein